MDTNSVQFFENNPVEGDGAGAELILAAWQLSNPENIGKIIRLAHNVGAQKVLFIKEGEVHRESKIKKTAGFSFDQMEWAFISENEFFAGVVPGYRLVVLETCTGAKNIFTEKLPRKAIILAGSESHGLPERAIGKSDQRVYIPMPGGCKSMNISNALSVAAFEWYRQQYHPVGT